jgi:hypothetical protein
LLFPLAGALRRPRVTVLAICPIPVRPGLSLPNPFRKVGAAAG